MIIIGFSGSTKCDWKLLNADYQEVDSLTTKGFNPFFEGAKQIFDHLQGVPEITGYSSDIKKVVYYGAGCSNPERKDVVYTALKLVFRNADVLVEHDLQGAAIATCEDKPGISCILGTGSNAGYFDGERLLDDVHALGYILGDEGSGSYFGKKLLADFLYEKLPPKMYEQLKDEYELNKEVIFHNVYKTSAPNIYLASFARFLSGNKDHYYVRNLVQQGLLEFLDIHVCRFENASEVPVHFVGSIAYYFEDILRNVAERKGLQVGKILKEPIHELVKKLVKEAKVK